MRRIYACLLELADPTGRDPVTARALTKRWVGAHYGGWPPEVETPWTPAADHRVRWRTIEHAGDRVFELTWTRPHPDPTLWRRTHVQVVTTAAAEGRAVLVESVESHDHKIRGHPPTPTDASVLAAQLVGTLACVDGGWRIGATPRPLGADRVLELDAFVRGGRRLPVVLVAADAAGRVLADADGIAADLAGLAHVVVLPDAGAVAAACDELGRARAVGAGELRLLWPDWRSSDAATRHQLWRAEDVAGPAGPRPSVRAAVVDLVVDAATLRIEDDAAADRLARAEAADELTHRRAELTRLRDAVAADQVAAHELVDEYQEELRRADDENYRLESALEREHELRVRAEHAYLELATRDEVAVPAGPSVRSLADAVRRARTELAHLVILPEAERSARAWQYDRADLAWADLVRLDSAASDWAADGLRTDFAAEARHRGLDWARDISEDARRKHAADYERRYEGETIVLGPHVRRSGRQILRIYCYLDPVRRKVVVGHVGGHLGDRTA